MQGPVESPFLLQVVLGPPAKRLPDSATVRWGREAWPDERCVKLAGNCLLRTSKSRSSPTPVWPNKAIEKGKSRVTPSTGQVDDHAVHAACLRSSLPREFLMTKSNYTLSTAAFRRWSTLSCVLAVYSCSNLVVYMVLLASQNAITTSSSIYYPAGRFRRPRDVVPPIAWAQMHHWTWSLCLETPRLPQTSLMSRIPLSVQVLKRSLLCFGDSTYQPRSSPLVKKLQSLLASQVQPPTTASGPGSLSSEFLVACGPWPS